MDPNVPTSFIPKRPLVNDPVSRPAGRPLGLLSLLCVVIIVATLIAGIGVFIFEKQLQSQKNQMEQAIVRAREGLGENFISDMKRLDSRIAAVKTLLQTHIVVTPIFKALEATTLRSVQYRSFAYTFGGADDGAGSRRVVKVEMAGTAKNYETIALQSDAFAKSDFIHDAVFSNLTVDDKKSTVNFNLRFTVDADELSYQSFIDSLQKPAPGVINELQP